MRGKNGAKRVNVGNYPSRGVCDICELPIHYEQVPVIPPIKSEPGKTHGEWLHDDYLAARQIVNGIPRNFHFPRHIVQVKKANG